MQHVASFFSNEPAEESNALALQERANSLLHDIDRANFDVLQALTEVVANSSESNEHLESFINHLPKEDIHLLKTLLVKIAAATDQKIGGSDVEGVDGAGDDRHKFVGYKRYGQHEN